MIISRALELGLTLNNLDDIDVNFIIEIAEQRNSDVSDDNEIEATPEILASFFK